MLLTFASLDRTIRNGWRWAVIAGLMLGAACLTRFAGILLLPIGGLILLSHRKRNWRLRLLAAALFGIATVMPIFAWNLRNAQVTGRASARSLMFHPMPLSSWRGAAETIVAWMLPEHLPWMPAICAFFVVGFVVLVSFALVRGHNSEARSLLLLLSIFVLLYLPFLFFASSFIDANVNFSPRLMVPMFPCVIVLIAIAWSTLANPARCVVLAILIALVIYNSIRMTRWSWAMSNRGQGYASTPWVHSDTLKAVAAAPVDLPIYTDGYDVIYLRTGRLVHQLPKARFRSLRMTNPSLDAEVDAMKKELRDGGGWIVLFDRIDRDDYLMSEEELRARLQLKPARKKQPDDGKILRLSE
jgi:4-amino-4-deoxy-L-arabinose transferase-like glycosyltransferase